jgi:hypothetical protein
MAFSTRLRGRLFIYSFFALGLVSLFAPSVAKAADGDVYFSIPNAAMLSPDGAGGADATFDVRFLIEGSPSSLPAQGWSMRLLITPLAGATGSITFNPPPLVGIDPNLNPAGVNPYFDFDRDNGGMSTGMLGATAEELLASAVYFPPIVQSLPTTDANDNVIVPSGAGLFAAPIHIAQGTTGSFRIDVIGDSIDSGVYYATGLAEPNDFAIYPTAPHASGVITFGVIPEPSSLFLAAIGAVGLLARRRRSRVAG